MTPSYRCGNHLDFFRGAPGIVAQPCIYDDGDTPSDKPSWLKIFLDPSEEEASFWARWDACRFEKNQARMVCSNVYDAAEELAKDDTIMEMKSESFMKMIRPLFNPTAACEDVNAILTRSSVTVFGRNHIYMRQPSADPEKKVAVYSYWPANTTKDLLSQSGIDKLRSYRSGDKTPPASDASDRAWQLLFIKKILQGESIRLHCYTRTCLDDSGVCVSREDVEIKPSLKDLLDKPEQQLDAANHTVTGWTRHWICTRSARIIRNRTTYGCR